MRRLLLLLAAASAREALAAPCALPVAPELTSQRCPSLCGTGPCVVYSDASSCRSNGDESTFGACVSTSDEIPAEGLAPCEVTFQCVDPTARSRSTWTLDLADAPAVATIRDLTYPEDDRTIVTRVVIRGAAQVKLDASVLATPNNVIDFTISGIHVPINFLESADLGTRKWEALTIESAGLTTIPVSLSALPLRNLNLADNQITTLNDNVDLPRSLASLNLTGNPLTTIPRAVFRLQALSTLALRRCNLTNVHVTPSQLAFLRQLHSFDADLTTTQCADGAVATSVRPDGSGSVCLWEAEPVIEATVLSSGGGGSDKTVVIVVVVVAVVIGVVLLVVGYCYCCRARKTPEYLCSDGPAYPQFYSGRSGPRTAPRPARAPARGPRQDAAAHIWGEVVSDDSNDGFLPDATALGGSNAWTDLCLLDRRINESEFKLTKRLEEDELSETWFGRLGQRTVVVKKLVGSKQDHQLGDALAIRTRDVLAVFKAAGMTTHPNILEIVAVSWTTMASFAVVMAHAERGSLRSLLDSPEPLTWAETKCQLAVDIVEALVFLDTHERAVRTQASWLLTSRTVFVDADGSAQLDVVQFSPSDVIDSVNDLMSFRYVAPEVSRGERQTSSALMYSFGVILAELDTRSIPFDAERNPNGSKPSQFVLLSRIAKGELLPTLSSDCPESIATVAQKCLSFDPAQRPVAMRVAYELRGILKNEF